MAWKVTFQVEEILIVFIKIGDKFSFPANLNIQTNFSVSAKHT